MEQGTVPPKAAGLALFALVAAIGVVAVLLLGDAWSALAFYPAVLVGLLAVGGSVGALTRVLRHDS